MWTYRVWWAGRRCTWKSTKFYNLELPTGSALKIREPFKSGLVDRLGAPALLSRKLQPHSSSTFHPLNWSKVDGSITLVRSDLNLVVHCVLLFTLVPFCSSLHTYSLRLIFLVMNISGQTSILPVLDLVSPFYIIHRGFLKKCSFVTMTRAKQLSPLMLVNVIRDLPVRQTALNIFINGINELRQVGRNLKKLRKPLHKEVKNDDRPN
jgi:hypothetical protein